MIYDSIERAYAILLANFATDFQALLTAKGVGGTTTTTFFKRQDPETFMQYIEDILAQLPAIGVYGLETRSQAKNQGRRVSEHDIVFDYYAYSLAPTNDVVLLNKRVELAGEAMHRSVDRIAGGTDGVYGAAELEGAAVTKYTSGYIEAKQGTWVRRATLTFTVHDEDTV